MLCDFVEKVGLGIGFAVSTPLWVRKLLAGDVNQFVKKKIKYQISVEISKII